MTVPDPEATTRDVIPCTCDHSPADVIYDERCPKHAVRPECCHEFGGDASMQYGYCVHCGACSA